MLHLKSFGHFGRILRGLRFTFLTAACKLGLGLYVKSVATPVKSPVLYGLQGRCFGLLEEVDLWYRG